MSVNATMTVSISPSVILTRSCSIVSRFGCRVIWLSFSCAVPSHQAPEQRGRVVTVAFHDPSGLRTVAGQDRLGDRLVLLARVVDVAVEQRDGVEHVVQADL